MATTTAPHVDTAHVSGRRKVRYANHDELLADVERLATAGYKQLGNWSLGQMCRHFTAAMNMALDGATVKAALPIRLAARFLFKNKAIAGPMKPGFKLPPKFAGTLIPDTTADADTTALPVVALTGWGQPQDCQRALAAGFDRHLVKPADPQALQAVLETFR